MACHTPSYVHKYDMVKNLKEGGTFLLNCSWDEAGLEQNLPASMKRALAEKHARLYTIDAIAIARRLGLGNRTNTILQASFFTLSGVIPMEQAVAEMKDAILQDLLQEEGPGGGRHEQRLHRPRDQRASRGKDPGRAG